MQNGLILERYEDTALMLLAGEPKGYENLKYKDRKKIPVFVVLSLCKHLVVRLLKVTLPMCSFYNLKGNTFPLHTFNFAKYLTVRIKKKKNFVSL